MDIKLEVKRSEYRSEFIHIPSGTLDRDKFLAVFGPIVADMEKGKAKEERLNDFVGEEVQLTPIFRGSPVKKSKNPRRYMTPQRLKSIKKVIKNFKGKTNSIEFKDKEAVKLGYKNWASMYAVMKKHK